MTQAGSALMEPPKHHFESAFNAMKAMQDQIRTLQMEVRANKEAHAAEVGQLQERVQSLEEALAEQRTGFGGQLAEASAGLADIKAIMDGRGQAAGQAQKSQAERLEETAQRLAEACEAQEQHNRIIGELEAALKASEAQRLADLQAVEAGLNAEKAEREGAFGGISVRLEETRQLGEANTVLIQQRLGGLMRHAQEAANSMVAGCTGGNGEGEDPLAAGGYFSSHRNGPPKDSEIMSSNVANLFKVK
mmetsp:Transcript_118109/g.252397  ORF Transcript_118109/g.252397 Transcript_118109/m.252397 type:complete len:248 (-) Transcript_118109:55-798(-)